MDGGSQHTRGRRLSPLFLAAFYVVAVRRSEFCATAAKKSFRASRLLLLLLGWAL